MSLETIVIIKAALEEHIGRLNEESKKALKAIPENLKRKVPEFPTSKPFSDILEIAEYQRIYTEYIDACSALRDFRSTDWHC